MKKMTAMPRATCQSLTKTVQQTTPCYMNLMSETETLIEEADEGSISLFQFGRKKKKHNMILKKL